MPILYLTEHDTISYAVKIENNELVIIQKFKKNSNKENYILCVKLLNFFG